MLGCLSFGMGGGGAGGDWVVAVDPEARLGNVSNTTPLDAIFVAGAISERLAPRSVKIMPA